MNVRLGDTHVFRFTTTDPVNGDIQNADSTPTVSVYEEATDTPVITPTPTNVATGHYRVAVAATGGNGFEAGKVYAVLVLATVGGVAGGAVIAHFKVDTRATDDLAFPATSGRSLAVEADGMVYADVREWLAAAPLALSSQLVQALAADIAAGAITSSEAPALANLDVAVSTRAPEAGGNVAAIKAKTDNLPSDPADQSLLEAAIAAVQADTDDIQTRLPAALVSGRMDASIGAVTASALTAAAFAAGAIDANALANDAVEEIALKVLTWASSNWEASAGVKSLGAAVMKAVHRIRDNAGTLEIYRSNGSTLHASQTITTDDTLKPIDELSGAA